MLNNVLTIKIRNSTSNQLNWYAFGFNEGLQNPSGVSVSVSESSMQQATRESSAITYNVESIKVKTQSSEQLDLPITIRTRYATGELSEQQFTPSTHQDIMDGIPNLIKIHNPGFKVEAKTTLTGIMLPNQSMTLSLNLKKSKKRSNFLNNFLNSIFGKKITLHGHIPAGSQIVWQ